MDGPPPPPPPHGANPGNTAGASANDGRYRTSTDLPDGPYDIFVIPPHSSGSGFLYLPSLQCHRNSFLAGIAAALVAVAFYVNVLPVLKAWFSSVVANGGTGVFMLVIGVAVAAWAFGRTQSETGIPGDNRGSRAGTPGGGSPGAGAKPPPGGQQYTKFGGQQAGAGFGSTPNTEGHNPGGQYPGGHQYSTGSPQPGPNAAPPPPQPEPQSSESKTNADKQQEWEKAREEAKRKEENRRRMDEFRRKKREEELKKAEELRKKEEELKRKEEEQKKKEEEEKKAQEQKQQREKEARERQYNEWKAKRAKEAEEKEAAARRQEAAAKYAAAREAAAANRAAKSTSSPQPPSPEKKAAPQKKAPYASAKTEAEDDAYSFRPYDRPKSNINKPNAPPSIFSESSYSPSQTTARTTPPPSRRGPYTTKDPDKIIIHGVYSFNNTFMRTPTAQLVSGTGQVTDGLIMRITTEGMFVDDDVRGIAQREWDIKAWTMKLVEVWCPLHGFNSSPRPIPPKTNNPFRFGTSHASSKAPTSEESDAYLAELLKCCKNQCRLGGGSGGGGGASRSKSVDGSNINSQTAASRGYHIVRASIRDQGGKKYVFILQDSEAWKVAAGLQRLRKGTQVRALGVCGLPANETNAVLTSLNY